MAKKKREPLVVASKVKAFVKDQKMMSSSEMVEALSEHVYNLLEAAVARAKANRRSTVKAQDL
jgi:histone H3/H4